MQLFDDIRLHHFGPGRPDWSAVTGERIPSPFFPAAARFLSDIEISCVACALPELFDLPSDFIRLLELLLTDGDFRLFCLEEQYPLCLALVSRLAERPLLDADREEWDRLGMFLGLSWSFDQDDDALTFRRQLTLEGRATTERLFQEVFRQPEVLVHVLARPPEARSLSHAIIHGAVTCLHFMQALEVFVRDSSGALASAAWNYHANWILPAAPLLLTAIDASIPWPYTTQPVEPERIGFPEPPLTPTQMGSPEPPLSPRFLADSVDFVCREAAEKHQFASLTLEFWALWDPERERAGLASALLKHARANRTASEEDNRAEAGENEDPGKKRDEGKPGGKEKAERPRRSPKPGQRKRPAKRAKSKQKRRRRK